MSSPSLRRLLVDDLDHMSYEIDRDATLEPSLVEMAETAITSLYKATEKSKKGLHLTL